MLTKKQEGFIIKRKTMVKLWPWMGSLMLIVIVGFWTYCFFKHPLFVNPFYVIDRIKEGALNNSTFIIMATFSPLAFLTCGFLLAMLILFIFSGMGNEKRLLEIIDTLMKEKGPENN